MRVLTSQRKVQKRIDKTPKGSNKQTAPFQLSLIILEEVEVGIYVSVDNVVLVA